ncbi:MAG: polyamine aminopropyltransferase [bacterium]|nr:polyamine aminopropyltransferase [bacterium]
MQRNFKNFVIDWYNPYGIGIALKIRKKIIEKRTKYQKIEVYETSNFGKVLFIDGLIQSIEKGEEVYHESLVHPSLFSHPEPKNVLIIGGGEGATLREVLKHPVEKVKMVDIDGDMIEIAKKYLKFDKGAFDDKRTEIIIEDGFKYIKESNEKYDIIIMDATDPGEIPSCLLYTPEFFKLCFSHLNKKGIFVTQGGTCIYLHHDRIKSLYTNLKKIFKKVRIYISPVFGLLPSWTFFSAVKGNIKIEKEPEKKLKKELFFYSTEIHESLFSLPNFLRDFK